MNRKSKQSIAFIMCLTQIAVMITLGSCDTVEQKNELTEMSAGGIATIDISGEILPINDNTADAAELSDYPIIINNTVIAERPRTAICLSSSLTEIIYELGYGDRLIGRGSYCEHPEEVKALSDFGRPASPDLEAIKSAAPDVLITATAIPNIDMMALSDLGIKVVYIPSPHTVDDFGRIYKAVGMIFDGLFDGEENGNKTFSAIRNTLMTSGISLGKFAYITEGLTAAGGDTFESAILSLFGTNIAADTSGYAVYSDITSEDQPDIVIISDELGFSDIENDDVLGSLDAVKSGSMIKIENSCFESPSGQIISIIDELKNTGGENE